MKDTGTERERVRKKLLCYCQDWLSVVGLFAQFVLVEGSSVCDGAGTGGCGGGARLVGLGSLAAGVVVYLGVSFFLSGTSGASNSSL